MNALQNKEIDRSPFICPGGMMNLITLEMMEEADVYWPHCHTNAKQMAKLASIPWQKGYFENIGLPFCMTIEAESMGATIDLGSKVNEPHVVDYAIHSVQEWSTLKPLDCKTGRAAVVIEALKEVKENNPDAPIIGNLTGPISVASSILDPSVFYKEIFKNKKDTKDMLNFICENLIAYGSAQIEAGANIIAISDPSGTDEILGPALFMEYVVFFLNKITDGLKDEHPECPILIHICGKMHAVYSEINQLHCGTVSFDALVNLREASEKLPDKVIMGNISAYALEFSSSEKIQNLAQSCMTNGADILAPACGLGVHVPVKNLETIVQMLQEMNA